MHTEKQLDTTVISSITYTTSFDLYRCRSYSYQVMVTAKNSAVGGYLQLQASNDDANWNDVTGARLNIANDTSPNVCMLEDDSVTYRFVRLKLAVTSGNYSAKVQFNAQEGAYS